MMTAEEVWCEVSDDELYNPGQEKKGTWEPKAEEILKVFEQLQSKKVLDLHWKCPGRQPPDSDVKEEEEAKEEHVTTPLKQEEKKPLIPNEFDFDEEDVSGIRITPRRTPGSAPKSQKKEAKMDKILKDMMQQRKLQAAEREARKLAGNKSPRTPASPGRARIGSPAGSPRTPNRQSPVRVGSAPNDPVTTTPLRAPLHTQSAIHATKLENSYSLSVTAQKTEMTVNTGQNIQMSQTGKVALECKTSQSVQRETNFSQTENQTKQTDAELGRKEAESSDDTVGVKQSAVEKMDTN